MAWAAPTACPPRPPLSFIVKLHRQASPTSSTNELGREIDTGAPPGPEVKHAGITR